MERIMGDYKTKVVDNIICSHLSGELDATLSKEWVKKLEEQERQSKKTLNRFHDVRNIDAVHLSFDDLWNIAQRRLNAYEVGQETMSAFWVSTPLNYGVSRMYQALTDGTPFHIEVFYKLEEIAEFLKIDENILKNIIY